ncbi:hypothetical protein KW799_01005 [Candidatus Parcubacteria bacterium]|nr:hypothetical protein [Candidatus Parcubacteria bacterium]
MNQTILWNGKILGQEVYKSKMFKKLFENPAQGDFGYAIIDGAEIKLEYDQKHKVWHVPGVDSRYLEKMLTSEVAHLNHHSQQR